MPWKFAFIVRFPHQTTSIPLYSEPAGVGLKLMSWPWASINTTLSGFAALGKKLGEFHGGEVEPPSPHAQYLLVS